MGRPTDAKQREALYQQLSSQILREAADLASLQNAARRALGHPAALQDATLAAQLRGFVAERERAMRMQAAQEHPEATQRSELKVAFERLDLNRFPTREHVQAQFLQLEREFLSHVSVYDETRAAAVLEQLRDLRRRFPVHVTETILARHEQDLTRLVATCQSYRRQIEDLADRGALAAQVGNQLVAAWVMRRLQAIHMLRPSLLSEQQLRERIARIQSAAEAEEHQEIMAELQRRERAVADEIRALCADIRTFQQVARDCSPDQPEYQEAEARYRAAVRAVRTHDADWMAGLIVELESLVEELNAPTQQVHQQLDRFIQSIRQALLTLGEEIRRIQSQARRPED